MFRAISTPVLIGCEELTISIGYSEVSEKQWMEDNSAKCERDRVRERRREKEEKERR